MAEPGSAQVPVATAFSRQPLGQRGGECLDPVRTPIRRKHFRAMLKCRRDMLADRQVVQDASEKTLAWVWGESAVRVSGIQAPDRSSGYATGAYRWCPLLDFAREAGEILGRFSTARSSTRQGSGDWVDSAEKVTALEV